MTARLFRLLPFLALASCVAPKPVEPPPPPVVAPPVPRPALPVTSDWRDIPLTPGDWSYADGVARFGVAGAPALVVRCDVAAHTVSLARTGAAQAPATMAIKTSAGDRALVAAPVAGPPPALAAVLPARDGFLDRMAFSRGRFIVSVAGTPRLVIPAWAEFARVVEDCRG